MLNDIVTVATSVHLTAFEAITAAGVLGRIVLATSTAALGGTLSGPITIRRLGLTALVATSVVIQYPQVGRL